MEKQYFVYIMTNAANSVLYTGVTSDLKKRAYEHRNKLIEGFTKTYNITKLVHYEMFTEPLQAIAREKQIKRGSRLKKINYQSQKRHVEGSLRRNMRLLRSARNDKEGSTGFPISQLLNH